MFVAPGHLQDDVYAKLALCGTTTGLGEAMAALNDAGYLKPEVVASLARTSTKRRLGNAKTRHANAATPYGSVVQAMEFPSWKLPRWEYAHPLSLLHYLSAVSAEFGELMAHLVMPCQPLNLIIYIDEIVPGNPLRHDTGRKLQAIYWAIGEWPQWLLQRSAAWPAYGSIRSSIVNDMEGGVWYTFLETEIKGGQLRLAVISGRLTVISGSPHGPCSKAFRSRPCRLLKKIQASRFKFQD